MKPKDRKGASSDANLEQIVCEAMVYLGLRFPSTPNQVERVEKLLEKENIQVPDIMADPQNILNKPRKFKIANLLKHDLEMQQNLARAAREGGIIPEHILERMRKDRDDAERNCHE